jgi:hypothetical protein
MSTLKKSTKSVVWLLFFAVLKFCRFMHENNEKNNRTVVRKEVEGDEV